MIPPRGRRDTISTLGGRSISAKSSRSAESLDSLRRIEVQRQHEEKKREAERAMNLYFEREHSERYELIKIVKLSDLGFADDNPRNKTKNLKQK